MGTNPDETKLNDLAARIRRADKTNMSPPQEEAQSAAQYSRTGYDFIGSVLGGAVLGWAIDASFPSLSPWPIIVMIALGFLVGIVIVWRALGAPEAK